MRNSFELLRWIGNLIGKPPGWERVVRRFAPPDKCYSLKDICVIRDGSAFLAQPSVPLGWHVAFFGSYEPELRRIIQLVLPKRGVAIDVGANVGWHTLLMARSVGEHGLVLAAEANPSVRQRLEENIHLNAFNNVQILPYAISNGEGDIQFWGTEVGNASSGDGHIVTKIKDKTEYVIDVESHSLDLIVKNTGPDSLNLIKIDVEGFEWPVLQGAEAIIAKFRPHILFEYNSQFADRGEGTIIQLNDFFLRHHYRLFAIGRNSSQVVDFSHWPKCANIWGVPQAC